MTCLNSQRDGQVSFANTRRTKKDSILLIGDKREIKKLHDCPLIQLRVKRKVILFNGFGPGKTGSPHGRLDAAFILGRHLFFKKMIQKRKIRALIFLACWTTVSSTSAVRLSFKRERLSWSRSEISCSIGHLLAHTGHIQQEIADPPEEKGYPVVNPVSPYPCLGRIYASPAADHA